MLTNEQIKAFRDRYGITGQNNTSAGSSIMDSNSPAPASDSRFEEFRSLVNEQRNQNKGFFSKVGDALEGFAAGGVKGVWSTIRNTTSIPEKIMGKATGLQRPQNDIFADTIGTSVAEDLTTPQNTAEQVGFTAEKIGEFFVPAAKAAKLEGVVNILASGIKSPLLASAARVGSKAAIQGLSAGLVTGAQTADLKKTGTATLTGAAVRGAMGVVGETARAVKLPERLYSIIFKNAKNDMRVELRSNALLDLQKKDPELYNEFTNKGLIKTVDGQPILNDTLAEKAIERGLKGSFRNMAREVVVGSIKSEDELQGVLSQYNGTVNLGEKQFINVLREIQKEYKNVGFGELSDNAKYLANQIQLTKGNVDGVTALEIRRFFDRMRISSSFDKPATSLSTTQANFKTLSDAVRSRINKVPGVDPIMKNYSFYIEALESITREAMKRGNSQILGLIDSLFLQGAGIATNPVGLLATAVGRRLIQLPSSLTRIGSALTKSTVNPATSGAINVISGGINNPE